MDSIRIKKNSLTHDILMISKVHSSKIDISHLKVINDSKFKDANKINRSLMYLNLHNLISLYDDNTWIITPLGKMYLYEIVQRNPQTTSS